MLCEFSSWRLSLQMLLVICGPKAEPLFYLLRTPSKNSARKIAFARRVTVRSFPPPWSVKDVGGSFVVKAGNDRPLRAPILREFIDPMPRDGSRSAMPSCPSYCGRLDLF
jgi:hypothetical protein